MAGEDWNGSRERGGRSRRGTGRREWGAVPDPNGVHGVDGAHSVHGGRGIPEDPASWLHGSDDVAGRGPADFSVADYRNRMLSGPAAELYGGSSPEPVEDSYPGRDYPGREQPGREQPGRGQPGRDYPGRDSDPYADNAAPALAAFGARTPSDSFDGMLPGLPAQAGAEPEVDSGLVRPYFRTRGRTRPSYDLAIETLVSTSDRGRELERVRVPEHRSICDLCLDTRSVAEVAALLRLPLGVVRVLVGDVAGLGLVLVHSANAAVGDRPSIEFMERVLSGLRRI
jgi:hypothetical protein